MQAAQLSNLINDYKTTLFQLSNNSNATTMMEGDNQNDSGTAFDLKIKLLQEELDRLERFNCQNSPPILNTSTSYAF